MLSWFSVETDIYEFREKILLSLYLQNSAFHILIILLKHFSSPGYDLRILGSFLFLNAKPPGSHL